MATRYHNFLTRNVRALRQERDSARRQGDFASAQMFDEQLNDTLAAMDKDRRHHRQRRDARKEGA